MTPDIMTLHLLLTPTSRSSLFCPLSFFLLSFFLLKTRKNPSKEYFYNFFSLSCDCPFEEVGPSYEVTSWNKFIINKWRSVEFSSNYIYIYIYICVCVCVCVWDTISSSVSRCTYIGAIMLYMSRRECVYIYIYIYVCVCVYVYTKA